MPNAAARPSNWLPQALGIVLSVTAYRVLMLAFDRTDLFVDEAQYWLWGQDLAFGYYSKPPLIGWVIRASTELGGSDALFWVRLPAPLLHIFTALILGWVAAERFGREAALWVTALYITLPMVTVGSYMISTDTVMFPLLALALGFWLKSLDRGGSAGLCFAAGLCAGLGFLAKYAAIYGLIGAGLAALAMWQGRPGWRPALVGLLGFAIAISPNVLWNLANGLTTLQHTLDNADWVRDPSARAGFNLAGIAEFFFGQFAVFGPVLFGALLWLGLRGGDGSDARRLLLWFSLPIVAIVCVQALLSEAYANWGVLAYQAGLLIVVPWLLTKPRAWLWGTLALHGAFAALIPFAVVFGTEWRAGPASPLLLERYLGRSAMSADILALAEENGGVVVADDRDILADLFYTGRDAAVTIWAVPSPGRPPHHYAQTRALPPSDGRILLVTRRDAPPPGCRARAEPLGDLAPESGAYRRRAQSTWIVDAPCLQP
ncbi:MAG: glycosyltransferase family 39 protein [Pseudomonadota bacterium]